MSETTDEATTGTAPAPVVDRAAAFAQGAPRIPRTFFYWLLAGAAVLGLGGTALEHLFSNAGLNPTPARGATTRPAGRPAGVRARTPAPLGASLRSFLGLSSLRPRPAPAIALVDQAGQPVSLAAQRGRVVVLTFFDGRCNDICPVLGAELHQAQAALGARAAGVTFLTVNTDPSALTPAGLAPAATVTGLGAVANWHMLTGPLPTLDALWRAYGVTVTVATGTGAIAHTDVMYFIDPKGRLRLEASPFADESLTGAYTLDPASVARFGNGVATYAEQLGGAR
ncbi:MAG TPA: SCO family protein [Acidimicrobiales bacterium]|nr:SCO family protein [Acidimicrobiales bacterium]